MSVRPVKVGMLGAGFILKSHATAVAALDGTSLHAVADLSIGRARSAARSYGFAHAFGSLEELAASDCDAVHILLPPFLHLDAAEALIEAGKHVFLEKPMGLDSARCAALAARAKESGVSVGVNHNFLFSPAYEAVRQGVRAGEFGRIDHLSVNWHFALPQVQFGPFDNWMLAAPANLIFELGSHLAAFALDLLGPVEIKVAQAGLPITLPTSNQVFRHWAAIGEAGSAAALLSLSTIPGQADRFLRVRGTGGSAQIDFGRDFGWREVTTSDNPLFEAHAIAAQQARQLARAAARDRRRRIRSLLAKKPDASPFEESIFRSIRAFYQGGLGTTDSRHDAVFGADVIGLCERIAEMAGAGRPSQSGYNAPLPEAAAQPKVLVVGGTGFIGRHLIKRLAEDGVSVRVLTRSANGAAIELRGLPVELMQGSHGDPATARRALEGIDIIYHLAKCDGRRWQDYVEGDIKPTRVLAEAALDARVKRFIYTGTIDSYASASARTRINSSTPVDRKIASRNLYARSKAACEALLQDLHRHRGLPLVIFRPGIVIGPGTSPYHLGIAQFAGETRVRYWGEGTNKLPFVLVDDVADALARARALPDIEGKAFLLTGDPLLSAAEYIEEVALHAGTRIDARPRSAWRYLAADAVKEAAKNLVRHPNRRRPTLHDWDCRSHRARYDSRDAQERLGWQPASTREELIERGVHATVDAWTR